MLRNEGYHVIEAGSGSEALGARRDRIDVAVVGCELGDIPGVDVLRALRAGGWRGPAILMGREAEADAVEAGRLGAEVLATPFAVEELLGAVLGALIAEALVAETA
jgi:DNA-binding response OmpR family regulator